MVGIGREPTIAGPRRGDLFVVDFPELGGHVIRGPHPVVVVKCDRMRASSTVVVAPMTSSAKAAEYRPPFLVPVAAREAGLSRDGFVKCDQPLTLPTLMLGARAGRLSPAALDRVDAALRFVLAI